MEGMHTLKKESYPLSLILPPVLGCFVFQEAGHMYASKYYTAGIIYQILVSMSHGMQASLATPDASTPPILPNAIMAKMNHVLCTVYNSLNPPQQVLSPNNMRTFPQFFYLSKCISVHSLHSLGNMGLFAPMLTRISFFLFAMEDEMFHFYFHV